MLSKHCVLHNKKYNCQVKYSVDSDCYGTLALKIEILYTAKVITADLKIPMLNCFIHLKKKLGDHSNFKNPHFEILI